MSPTKLSQSPLASQSLLETLQSSPHQFLQPSAVLHTAVLQAVKEYLDPLAQNVSSSQGQRLQRERKTRKRKRSQRYVDGEQGKEKVLKIRKIALADFAVEQVWEQARRVLDAAGNEALLELANIAAQEGLRGKGADVAHGDGANGWSDASSDDSDEGDDDEIEDSDPEEVADNDFDGLDDEAGGVEFLVSEEEDLGAVDGVSKGHDGHGDVEDDASEDSDDQRVPRLTTDKFGLNDGFFSIDDFNKGTQFLEIQDARGDPDDGAASDEEDVDWDVDPLNPTSAVPQKSKALGLEGAGSRRNYESEAGAEDGTEELSDLDDDDEEAGPTFGNMALTGAEEDSDDELSLEEDGLNGDMYDTNGLGDTSNIMYADFFAAPARAKRSKNKRGRPNPHNFPTQNMNAGGSNLHIVEKPSRDEDTQRTIARVHRDLFSESSESEPDDSQEAQNFDTGDPKERRSTHERRQAALQQEIRKLEQELVSKRDWQLAGEARATDRPQNALLEEDLDFERVGKPVPVITAEVSEDIEALIKRRIVAREFDEVVRRRPDSLNASVRRGKLDDYELSEQRSKQGLAELYEEQHLRRTDPNFVEVKDEKLKKEHGEIERLWKDVAAKLDALSSWHYRPKPQAPQLEVRVDAPTLTMEEARPTAGSSVAGASALAPQEVYRAGDDRREHEVLGTDGLPIKREELSREQKRRRRQRDKERKKKAGVNEQRRNGGLGLTQKTMDERNVIGNLKRSGVKLIGKKGQLTDVDGRDAKKTDFDAITGGAFKL